MSDALPPPPSDPAGPAPGRPDAWGPGWDASSRAQPSNPAVPTLLRRPGLRGAALRNLVILVVLAVALIVTTLVVASSAPGGPVVVGPVAPSPAVGF